MGRVLRWTSGSVVVLAALAAAAPFLIPVSHFIPDLTRLASERLGHPVTVEELRLYLLPTPRAVASRITIGRQDQVTIGELDIRPDFLDLLVGRRSVKLIHAHRVAIDHSVLAVPRALPKKTASSGKPLDVKRVLLTSVKLNHPSLELPVFDLELGLGERLSVREVRMKVSDGSVRVFLDPKRGGSTDIALSARNWTLPIGAPLTFEALEAQGTLRGGELELSQIDGLMYGGKVSGSARVEWGKQWLVAGKASLAGVDLVPVQKALGKPAKLSGRLKGDAAFRTQASTPAQLRDALALHGPFEVLGGAYKGVDLAKAGSLGSAQTAADATPFHELKGKLELRGQHVKLNELCVRSPRTVAGGSVEIAPDKKLSGRLDVSVAQTGGIVGVPVALGGTTDEPTMRPTKGYLIGAAIGTVLLPGIGTSIGSSLGGRLEGSSGCK